VNKSSTIKRSCRECGASLEGQHPNRINCAECAPKVRRRQTQKGKGISLASDALTCPVCRRKLNTITAGHFRKHGYPTAAAFKAAFGLDILRAPSLCRRQSAFMASNNPTKGRHRTPEERQRMSAARKGKGIGVAGKYERTPDIRDKISRGVAAYQLEHAGDYTKGEWVLSDAAGGEVFVRSSWEKRVVAILDRHPSVVRVWVEPLIIPYTFEGQTRRYLPDFLIEFEGGIWELWEVKATWCIKHPKNVAKFKALNEYVEQKGWNGRLVTLNDIKGMEQLWGGNTAP
jgi:hypothetical protein